MIQTTLWVIFVPVIIALQTEQSASTVEDPSSKTTNDRRLQDMKRVVAAFEIVEVVEGGRRPVHLVDRPLLRFIDGERHHVDGTLWVWGRQGRPQVFSEVYLKQKGEKEGVYHSLVSASANKLVATSPIGVEWQPAEAGTSPLELPNSSPPADESAIRLRQMKTLARRFRAWSIDNQQRTQLRLMPRPIHRYDDPDTSVIDGAAFAFVTGTNPEVIVLLEAVQDDSGGKSWQFSPLRRGNAAQYVSLDGKTVWQRSVRSEGGPKETWLYYYYSPSDRSQTGRPRLRGANE